MFCKNKNVKKCIKLYWNFQRGGGLLKKKSLTLGRYGYFLELHTILPGDRDPTLVVNILRGGGLGGWRGAEHTLDYFCRVEYIHCCHSVFQKNQQCSPSTCTSVSMADTLWFKPLMLLS